jgi:hypothetical protein
VNSLQVNLLLADIVWFGRHGDGESSDLAIDKWYEQDVLAEL